MEKHLGQQRDPHAWLGHKSLEPSGTVAHTAGHCGGIRSYGTPGSSLKTPSQVSDSELDRSCLGNNTDAHGRRMMPRQLMMRFSEISQCQSRTVAIRTELPCGMQEGRSRLKLVNHP